MGFGLAMLVKFMDFAKIFFAMNTSACKYLGLNMGNNYGKFLIIKARKLTIQPTEFLSSQNIAIHIFIWTPIFCPSNYFFTPREKMTLDPKLISQD
jgi:hypothetical protein